MSNEPKPNREGYFEFVHAVNNGNKDLYAQGERDLWKEHGLATTLPSCYYQLYELEKNAANVATAYSPPELIAQVKNQLANIRNPHILQDAVKRVDERVTTWDKQRRAFQFDFSTTQKSALEQKIKERQAEKPDETESESWFWAKVLVDGEHVGRMALVNSRLRDDLKFIVDDAYHMDHVSPNIKSERDLANVIKSPGPPQDGDPRKEKLLPNSDQVRTYIVEKYPELKDARDISIEKVGDLLRVMVEDSQRVSHAFRVSPQDVFRHLNAAHEPGRHPNEKAKESSEVEKAVDQLRRALAQSKDRDRDDDREH